MKYVGFPHFDCLWPPSSYEQHCKSKNAKYLHLEDVEVKWRFSTTLWAILEQIKWLKGFIPRSIASMMYAEHVLRLNVDWSTIHMQDFGAIEQGLLVILPIYILYVPVPEWFKTNPKLYVKLRVQEKIKGRWGGPNRLMEAADGRCHVVNTYTM